MTSLGVVGCGSWGMNWVKTLAALPDVDFRWCCDLLPANLDRVRQAFPNVRTTSSLDDLLNDRDLDGVVLATVAPTHYDLASKVLRAGKHVLVEKPMTLNTADATALARLAAAHRRVLQVGHLLEYHPAIGLIRRMIESGELGDLQYLYLQRLNFGKVRSEEDVWWSLAPHDVSVALRLFGDWPVSVQCRGQKVVQKTIADVVFATLEFPGGRMAHIHVSWLDPDKVRKLTVVGSRKMVVFDDMLPTGKVIVHDKTARLADNGKGVTMQAGEVTRPTLDPTEPLVAQARHFCDCIAAGTQPLSNADSGIGNVAVLEYGSRSLLTGTAVAIPPREECVPASRLAS